MDPTYTIHKLPTTWRVYHDQGTMQHGWPGPDVTSRRYDRCETLANLRAVVKDVRARGTRRHRHERHTPQWVKDRDELRAMASAFPSIGTALKDLIQGLKDASLQDEEQRHDIARDVCRIILRTLDVEGDSGCRLCRS